MDTVDLSEIAPNIRIYNNGFTYRILKSIGNCIYLQDTVVPQFTKIISPTELNNYTFVIK